MIIGSSRTKGDNVNAIREYAISDAVYDICMLENDISVIADWLQNIRLIRVQIEVKNIRRILSGRLERFLFSFIPISLKSINSYLLYVFTEC